MRSGRRLWYLNNWLRRWGSVYRELEGGVKGEWSWTDLGRCVGSSQSAVHAASYTTNINLGRDIHLCYQPSASEQLSYTTGIFFEQEVSADQPYRVKSIRATAIPPSAYLHNHITAAPSFERRRRYLPDPERRCQPQPFHSSKSFSSSCRQSPGR